MLSFEKIDRDHMEELAPYFAAQTTHISDFSLGFQFMWNKSLVPEYAFAGGCLILREFHSGKDYFHYPLSNSGSEEAESVALDEIERYCRDASVRLHFTNVPRRALLPLLLRYGQEVTINNRRRWRDYLYLSEDFETYPGKKYAGQRNHVNKFCKNYHWEFRKYTPADEKTLYAFLNEYAASQLAKGVFLAKEELDEAIAAVPRLESLHMFAGLLFAEGKLVGFSAGERCGDMVVVHLEKALKGYEGVYPMLAQQFARTFCGDAKYLNRMDDAGDLGLRKSKLQYLPCEIVDKYNVFPHRAIDSIAHFPEIETPRTVLREVADEDAAEYARLASDSVRNRYWGYDWRKDFPQGIPEAKWFLELAREDFHRKEEIPLGIYAEGKLLGEAVMHRFGYRAEVELGVRLLPEAEGKGYASEAMRALAGYAFGKLGLERAEAKCFRENTRSEKMLLSSGFRPAGSDDTYLYFYKTPEF